MHHRYYFMRSFGTDSRRPVVLRMCVVALLVVYSLTLAPQHDAVAAERTVSFVNDVMPILPRPAAMWVSATRRRAAGKRGFSFLCSDLSRGRTLITWSRRGGAGGCPSPHRSRSLLLLKASGQVPHGGGVRLDPSSDGYALIRDWIRQGAPLDSSSAPQLVAFEVQPNRATIQRGGRAAAQGGGPIFGRQCAGCHRTGAVRVERHAHGGSESSRVW